MGYDKERGDVLSVVNGAFTPPDKEAILETPFWKQPGFIDSALEIGKNVMIAMLVLYLMLGVLRPMMRRVSEAPASPLAALPNTSGQAGGEAGANGGTLPALGVDPYDQSLNSAKQIAKQDPRVVANVVKGWVAGNA
jgi:flagellar M-ring protein FliF